MKNKKWLLLFIILLPSLFWVILESSTINSYKLFYYGPKTISASGDTVYYQVPDVEFQALNKNVSKNPNKDFPLYVIMFIKNDYKKDAFRIAGLWEYANYKKEKIEHIPFILITEDTNGKSETYDSLKTLTADNIRFLSLPAEKYDSINKLYFKEKPIHIDYSFFALVDANKNIRGYYDGRFAAEIKRLGDEYKHMRLKEEKEKILKSNEIKSN